MSVARWSRCLALVLVLVLPGVAWSYPGLLEGQWKAPPAAFAVRVERYVLPNGLVVLLSPDPTISSVAVSMHFRSGTLYEPAGRSGMAHLVEHIMASGPTPETNYALLLEKRQARYFNAATGLDSMSFDTIVPAAELPLALWVAAERLGTLPALIDQPLVEKNREVVGAERSVRSTDAPYGLVDQQLMGTLYPAPHPWRGGVLGTTQELGSVTAEEVRAFVGTYLVPANAVLVVVGRFDPQVAKRLIEEGVGRLPAGKRAEPRALPPRGAEQAEARKEPRSRLPRVTLAWRLQNIPHGDAMAMELGAFLLTLMTDGAWGMQIDAGFAEYSSESLFRMDLTLPSDETQSACESDAVSLVRILTHREVPVEDLLTANLALDRATLFSLDTLAGRERLMARVELLLGKPVDLARHLEVHWALDNDMVRDTAKLYLRGPKVIMHARPTRPRPAKRERE